MPVRDFPQDAHPEMDKHDLSHLDAYTAATRLVIDNRETAAFTMATVPLPHPAN